MMQPVKPPDQDDAYPQRENECRDALESKVQQLLEEACRAGWKRDEVVTALIGIAEDMQKAPTG